MTREEAISEWTFRSNHIKKWLDEYGEEPSIRHYVELIDMAIEALKAEPIRCGECENYIDRRCIKANHHVAAHGNCMGVFGAKRREL